MLKLINITMNEKTIEADYVPESSNQKGHISLDLKSKAYKAIPLENYGEQYCRMAANGLLRTLEELKSGKITSAPESRTVMWY